MPIYETTVYECERCGKKEYVKDGETAFFALICEQGADDDSDLDEPTLLCEDCYQAYCLVMETFMKGSEQDAD